MIEAIFIPILVSDPLLLLSFLFLVSLILKSERNPLESHSYCSEFSWLRIVLVAPTWKKGLLTLVRSLHVPYPPPYTSWM